MELPCPAPMILSIKLPRALLQIVLEQCDIDDSTIGVDVPRAAGAFDPISSSHRQYFWDDVAISFSCPERSFDALQVEIVRMGARPYCNILWNCCFHCASHLLDRYDFLLQATDHETFGKFNQINWRVRLGMAPHLNDFPCIAILDQ
jgi:hypothetical protein